MVYPRVGGETNYVVSSEDVGTGLSPRGRGNRAGLGRAADGGGSIPAWAGKPLGSRLDTDDELVYPRVGGETAGRHLAGAVAGGLSPRGRGNPMAAMARRPARGSIPAWAGKPGARP